MFYHGLMYSNSINQAKINCYYTLQNLVAM